MQNAAAARREAPVYAPGFYDNLPEAVYRAAAGISQSSLKHMSRSPAYFRYREDHPRRPTPDMQLGTALHCAWLEGLIFLERYAEAPTADKRTKLFADAQAKNPGKEVLTRPEMIAVQGMAAALLRTEEAMGAKAGADIEASLFWRRQAGGREVACKARPDIIRRDLGCIFDIKTVDDASEDAFLRKVVDFRYHVQAAMYLEGAARTLSQPFDTFAFIVVERDPPHGVAVYRCPPEALARGRELLGRYLAQYAECEASGRWPDYSAQGVRDLPWPAWASYRE